MIKAILFFATLMSLTTISFAATSRNMIRCKNKLIRAADTIQSVSNKVPGATFSDFIKTGNGPALMIGLIKIGGSLNANVGGKILFKKAKKVMVANKTKVTLAARACKSSCSSFKVLKEKCNSVNKLAGYLNKISLALGKKVAWQVKDMGGTSGFKRSVEKVTSNTSTSSQRKTQRTQSRSRLIDR